MSAFRLTFRYVGPKLIRTDNSRLSEIFDKGRWGMLFLLGSKREDERTVGDSAVPIVWNWNALRCVA